MKRILGILFIILMAATFAGATLTNTSNLITYACTGSTGPYAFTFPIFEDGDLTLLKTDAAGTETTLALTTDYTVSLTGDAPSGGSVTLTSACASGYKLTIIREMDLTQETDYIAGDLFPADAHENALDKQVMMAQQLNETLSRAPKVTRSSGLSDLTIPVSASRALCWNSAGTSLTTCATTTFSVEDFDVISAHGSSLATAVTDIGASKTTLFIDVDTTVSSDLTVPSNINIRAMKESLITIATTKTLTIAGAFSGPEHKVFDCQGTGKVSFTGPTSIVYPQWWGAVGDGTTDDTTALQAAITTNQPVFLPKGTYKITAAITVPADTVIIGAGKESVISSASTTANMFALTGSRIVMRDMKLTRSVTASAGAGISATTGTAWQSHFENIYIEKQYDGISTNEISDTAFGETEFIHIESNENIRYGYHLNKARGNWVDCLALKNGATGFFVNNNSGAGVAGIRFTGCEAWNNNGRGWWIYTADGSATSTIGDVWLDQCVASYNNQEGLAIDTYGQNFQISNSFFEYSGYLEVALWAENQNVYGIHVGKAAVADAVYDVQFSNCNSSWNAYGGMLLKNTKNVLVNGCLFKDNGMATANQVGIRLEDMDAVTITGTKSYDRGSGTQLYGLDFTAGAGTANNNHIITGNDFNNNATGGITGSPGALSIVNNNLGVATQSIASAGTITLTFGDVFNITGTTSITSVTASWPGRRVTLIFAGILTFTDGSNLKLAGDFVTTADDTITLVCDGTNWWEVSRSVN